jgi:hypothetical protein
VAVVRYEERGQLWWVDDELPEDEDVDDGLEDAFEVAACAMAAPDPTSMPESTTAPRARFTGVSTCSHLLSMYGPGQSRGPAWEGPVTAGGGFSDALSREGGFRTG